MFAFAAASTTPKHMKKTSTQKRTKRDDYELRDAYDLSKMTIVAKGRFTPHEYRFDYSKARPNRFAARAKQGYQTILLHK